MIEAKLRFLNDIAAEVRASLQLGQDAIRGRANADHVALPRTAALISGVETGQTLVGLFPPQPATLRGRVGRALVSLVNRCLFWYTPTIQAFQHAVAAAFQEHGERTSAIRDELSQRLLLIQKENRSLREEFRVATEAFGQFKEASSQQAGNLTERVIVAERQLSRQGEALEDAQAEMKARFAELEKKLAAKEHLAETLAEARLLVNEISNSLGRERERGEALAEAVAGLHEDVRSSSRKLGSVDQFTLSTRAEMMLLERRLNARLNDPNVNGLYRDNSEQRPQLLSDVLYCEFEDLFRGSQEEIKARVETYIPRIQDLNLGSPQMPILDVGCGRGEWLDVLREHRLLASGVDSNSLMIATCRGKGLAVEEQDGLKHLQSLPNSSIGAVTAFHFVEHLPLAILISFIDETLRVLKPGGVALFETPNPDNILVGACNFYLDPTHQRPIPSGLLRFLMRSRGFSSIEVLPLHPYPPSLQLEDSGNPAARLLNERLFGCQDYAVIASKP